MSGKLKRVAWCTYEYRGYRIVKHARSDGRSESEWIVSLDSEQVGRGHRLLRDAECAIDNLATRAERVRREP